MIQKYFTLCVTFSINIILKNTIVLIVTQFVCKCKVSTFKSTIKLKITSFIWNCLLYFNFIILCNLSIKHSKMIIIFAENPFMRFINWISKKCFHILSKIMQIIFLSTWINHSLKRLWLLILRKIRIRLLLSKLKDRSHFQWLSFS